MKPGDLVRSKERAFRRNPLTGFAVDPHARSPFELGPALFIGELQAANAARFALIIDSSGLLCAVYIEALIVYAEDDT